MIAGPSGISRLGVEPGVNDYGSMKCVKCRETLQNNIPDWSFCNNTNKHGGFGKGLWIEDGTSSGDKGKKGR